MKTELITYEESGKVFEGFLAYNPALQGKRPGVILCHAWRGRDEFVCDRAIELAQWGYAAFALDLYGKGVLGKTKEENIALMNPLVENRGLLQNRLHLALKTFLNQPIVDSHNVAALGFCFGGLCALDLARSGADIKGAISVHGLLNAPENLKTPAIKAKVLALHGHDDPIVPPEHVLAFEQEMTERHADWQLHVFGNTMHAFTNPIANDPAAGTVYSPLAAKRSWQMIRNFLEECLKESI